MRINQRVFTQFLVACWLVAALALVPTATPVRAADQVVNNCSNDDELRADLETLQYSGGGSLTFNCGVAKIVVDAYTMLPNIITNTTIDGGDNITLSGGDNTPLFLVGTGVTLTLNRITITEAYNSSSDGGAIINYGTLNINNSRFIENNAVLSGGAIVSYGPLHIVNSEFAYNHAVNGGALYPRWGGAVTTITGSSFHDNHAAGTGDNWGGAILAWDGAPVTIVTSDFYSNGAHRGGAIYNFANSLLTLNGNTRLWENTAWRGGGLFNNGEATLNNVILSDNRVTDAASGGGVHNGGTITLTHTILDGNQAGFDGGGGLYNTGMATLTDVTLNHNDASWYGGGLRNLGTATLTGVTLSGNIAAVGGGVYNDETLILTNVTLSGNGVTENGGGLYNTGETATLTNVTLSGNTAGVSGGGIFISSGSVTTQNSIVANSPSGGNCAGAVTNSGFNLSSDTTCGFNYVPNLMLGPLANNGGQTKTHLPLPGSPAIDFVALGCPPPATDQRGAARPMAADCDAGAVEAGAILPLLYLPVLLD